MTLRSSLPVRLPSLLSVAAALSAPVLHAQSLAHLPVLPGDTFGQAVAVSRDGSVVVGASGLGFFEQCRGVRWTAAGGLEDLGMLPGATNMLPTAVSADGATVAGFAFLPDRDAAFRWTAAGGLEDLGRLPGATYGASAYGISRDGNVVTGISDSANGTRAFRWTPAGMTDLGVLPGGAYSFGFAVSGNGNVVVGLSDSANGENAFRWTQAGGMQILPRLVADDWAAALAVSTNGHVAVGFSGAGAVRWVGNNVQSLGSLPGGGAFSAAYAVNGNGTMVGGGAEDETGQFTAMLWTPSLGMVALEDLLPWFGIDLTGWRLDVVTAISANGSTIVGIGRLDDEDRGFVVRMPSHGNGGHGCLTASAHH